MRSNTYLSWIAAIVAIMTLDSCNKDDVIIDDGSLLPKITLENEYGIYTVKIGHDLTIAPSFENVGSPDDVSWTIDDQVIATGFIFTATWPEQGEFYLTVRADNNAGRTYEDLRIDVLELTPPVISMNIPAAGFQVAAGTNYTLSPYIQHADDCGELHVTWSVDGQTVGEGPTYTFNQSEPGLYHVIVTATNDDGTTEKDFDINVTDGPPYAVSFPTPSYFYSSTTRYTFAGRPVYLRPTLEYFTHPSFSWCVDGQGQDCDGPSFAFTPESPGEYEISVTVSEDDGASRSATVTVVCVDATEASRMRQRTGASSSRSDRVYEYTPAPGQFIGDTATDGMPGEGATLEQANIWAEKRLANGNTVSLGSYGGYIVVGFDHSVTRSTSGYELAIGGNAFVNADGGGSNEPGIVWVMQDINGNGLPDDEWYELKGSEYGQAGNRTDFAVTYFRPSGPGMDVNWTDSDGNSGTVDYLPDFHSQSSYYPGWVTASSYTLRGSLIRSKSSFDPATGFWSNSPYAWGYADNAGSDNLGSNAVDGAAQATGFKLSNAVRADGSPAELMYFDFVKVQVAVLAKSGILGEVSTEVCGFQDYTMGQ